MLPEAFTLVTLYNHCMYVCMHMFVGHMHEYLCICMYMHTCINLHVCLYVCRWLGIQAGKPA